VGGPGAKILYAQGAGEDLDGGLGEGGRRGYGPEEGLGMYDFVWEVRRAS